MEATSYFSIVLTQLASFVVYAMIGVYAVKKHVISKDGLGVLSAFIIKIALPIMIFSNTINGATREQLFAALPVLGASVLMFAGLLGVGTIIVGFFNLNYNESHVFRACSMFGNVGFMGIPILIAILPERGMLYMSLFTIVDQLCLWTIGLALCTPEESSVSMSMEQKLQKMINPPTVAILGAIILICAGIKLPGFINSALIKVGNSTTPLALAYLGGMFALMEVSQYLKRLEIYFAVIAKMVLYPIAFYGLIAMVPGITNEIAVTLTLLSAMPSMSAIPMIAQSQGSAGEYATGMVFVTTVCLLGTLPLVCFVLGW